MDEVSVALFSTKREDVRRNPVEQIFDQERPCPLTGVLT
jgi:hypothetical protein